MNRYAINIVLVLTILNQQCHTVSIGTVSDVKDGALTGIPPEFYPDWVPFKNKHGAELGEFQDVAPKAKVKKRLAPPMNFVLKAVAEPEGDDYYDKGQGESDNEGEFDKKEWSDEHRAANDKHLQNHTDISDIESLVKIIKDSKPGLLETAIRDTVNDIIIQEKIHSSDANEESSTERITDDVTTTGRSRQRFEDESKEITINSNNKVKPTEYVYRADDNTSKERGVDPVNKYKVPSKQRASKKDAEYDDDSSEERNNEQKAKEQKENEAIKTMILESVDQLKQKHAEEQRFISEKSKIDDLFIENMKPKVAPQKKDSDKDYEDNDDYDDGKIDNKYKPKELLRTTPKSLRDEHNEDHHELRTVSDAPDKKTNLRHSYNNPYFSLFDHPELYLEKKFQKTTTIQPDTLSTEEPIKKTKQRKKFHPRKKNDDVEDKEHIHISFEPADKGNKPTLFFPKKKIHQRKRKNKPKTYSSRVYNEPKPAFVTASQHIKMHEERDPADTDSSASDAISTTDIAAPVRTLETTTVSQPTTEPEATAVGASSLSSQTVAPSALNAEPVTDVITASSDHEKEKVEDHEHERGGGKKYHSEHAEEKGEHGKKAYEGHHEETKSAKGHHDKEGHHGTYADEGSHEKQHHDEKKHYGEHHHEEEGKKQAKYEESGKHSKGHSTKGSHDVHKKEEYEKKVEFFEEDGDSSEEEKHGGYHNEKGHKEGGHFKEGNLQAGHHQHDKGDIGHFEKGGHHHELKGHKQAAGHDSHAKHGQEHFHKGHHEGGKKWVYHHGSPAKNAGLTRIDRRTNPVIYDFSPTYYG